MASFPMLHKSQVFANKIQNSTYIPQSIFQTFNLTLVFIPHFTFRVWRTLGDSREVEGDPKKGKNNC